MYLQPVRDEDKAQASHGAIAKSRGRGGKYDCESFGSGTALWTLGRSFQVASLYMSFKKVMS